MMTLPRQVELALTMLEKSGYDAYIVGGCVRDFLLGHPPTDFDITTNAKPDLVLQIFADFRTIETGLQHGTVTIMIDGLPLELTTYRIDGSYSDNRRPDTVEFTQSIADDLSRRDYTMNAIAWSPDKGFGDPFGGNKDIKHCLIKAVGDPLKRFDEDALRILRGVRFSSVLGFEIEEKTFSAMIEKKDLLLNVSSERIYVELCKTLLGKNFKNSFGKSLDLWSVILPDLSPMQNFKQNHPCHVFDVFEHTLNVVENTPPVLHLRLAALFHDIGKPATYSVGGDKIGHFYGHCKVGVEITAKLLARLKCDNATKEKVLPLVEHHDDQIEENKKCIKRFLRKMNVDLFRDLLTLKRADILSQNPEYHYRLDELKNIEKLLEEIVEENECFNLKSLDISGSDLLKLGFTRGKGIGEALNLLLDKVMNDEIENKHERLMAWLNANYPK